jgi:hypothetical protein
MTLVGILEENAIGKVHLLDSNKLVLRNRINLKPNLKRYANKLARRVHPNRSDLVGYLQAEIAPRSKLLRVIIIPDPQSLIRADTAEQGFDGREGKAGYGFAVGAF